MASLVGTWSINANGFRGLLNLTGNGDTVNGGNMQVDPGHTDPLNAVSFDGDHQLTFDRPARGGIQHYTAFVFESYEPIGSNEALGNRPLAPGDKPDQL